MNLRQTKWAGVQGLIFCLVILCFDGCGRTSRNRKQTLSSIADIKSSFHGERASQVRFQGVVTVVNPNFGFLVVQDQSAGVRVQAARFFDSSLTGHRVEITGSQPAGSGTDTISDASVRDLGIGTPPQPFQISAKELQKDTYDGKLVRLLGIARAGLVDANGQLVVPVRIGAFEVAVRFTEDHGLTAGEFADAEVRVIGVASTDVDLHGHLTDLTIFASDSRAIQVQRLAPLPAALPIGTLKEILVSATTSHGHRVRLRGSIETAGEGRGLRFSDGSTTLPISSVDGLDTRLTGPQDIVAFVDRFADKWSLNGVKPTFEVAVVAQHGPSSLVTTVAGLHALKPEEAGKERPVLLDCIVTYYDKTWQASFVRDPTGGVYVSLHGSGRLPDLRAGDHVRLRGFSGAGDFAPVVQAPVFEFLGHPGLPPPDPIPPEMVLSGQADSQWVAMEGIVQGLDFDGHHPVAKLSYGSHNYRIIFPPAITLTPGWIDARLRVRGAAGTVFNGKRQVLGVQLFVQGLDQLERLPDPVSARAGEPPATPIDELLQFHPDEVPGHRVHLRGKVLATNTFGPTWIKDDSGAVAIREHNEISLADGDVVDVVGFPVAGAFAVEIHEGVIRKRSSGPPVAPIDVTPQRALFQGVDGQLVTLEGRLISEYQSGQEQTLLLRNGKATFSVRGNGQLPAYDIGSVLRLSGICTVAAKRFRGVLVPNSFEVRVDSPSAVQVIETAPWMTQQRALWALGITTLLIAAAMVWVASLRKRVAGQTQLIGQKLLEVEGLKEKAEAASSAKSQFLANMSHEIRTPMNGILGFAELAMQSESPAEVKECLSTIRSSGDALLAILNDLLDLSKIEAGKFEIEEAPFSLRKLVSDAGKVFAFGMREKNLQFAVSVGSGLPDLLIGDAFRLRQILLNLLSNAVKFTQAGTISLAAVGQQVGDRVDLRLVVGDSGMGIPAEKQGQIFEAFRQADDFTARKFGGTGLGLSICLKLAGLMGGRVEVESAEGKGSTFTVFLSLQVAASRRDPNRDASARGSAAAMPAMKVLLAEDNPVNQMLAVKLLKKHGHEVAVAGNGKSAVEQFEQGAFDLILMDVQMPEMDGLEASAEIRRIEQASGTRIPIIAMTAQTMKGDRDNCFAAGMDAFVSKPIRLPDLWAAINSVKTASACGFERKTG